MIIFNSPIYALRVFYISSIYSIFVLFNVKSTNNPEKIKSKLLYNIVIKGFSKTIKVGAT